MIEYSDFLVALLVFIPTFIANATPVVAKGWPGIRHWNTPISEKRLGKNKTWRGLITGTIMAGLTSVLIFSISFIFLESALISSYRLIVSDGYLALALGILQGIGALGGDIIKSLIKRSIGIPPGAPWPIFDGIDYILGSLLVMFLWYTPTFLVMLFLIILAPLMSLIANIGAYTLGWKKVWW